MSTLKRCFVIMPFSATISHNQDYWKKHFEKFLKPNIEKIEDVIAFRSEPLRGNIATNIIIDLIKSDIVVADLTDFNPNVLWELGIRQSFKNCTITIAESGTSIPFHFSHKGIFFYDPNHLDDASFIQQLTDAIKDCVKHPEKPDSPVLEAITGRGTLFEIIKKDETKRRINALYLECVRNKRLIEAIYQTIEENQKIVPKGNATIGDRLHSYAIQLLSTSRYLDKNDVFYMFFINLMGLFDSINSALNDWPRSQENVEIWFLEKETRIEDNIKKYEEIILEIRQEARK